MKFLFLILCALFSFQSFSSSWKKIAKTIDCPEEVEVFAKQDEKYLMLEIAGKSYQLSSEKKENFSKSVLIGDMFQNQDEKIVVTMPGQVEGNSPKFQREENGKKIHCRMRLI